MGILEKSQKSVAKVKMVAFKLWMMNLNLFLNSSETISGYISRDLGVSNQLRRYRDIWISSHKTSFYVKRSYVLSVYSSKISFFFKTTTTFEFNSKLSEKRSFTTLGGHLGESGLKWKSEGKWHFHEVVGS